MFLPYKVDVPMARVPWANWILIGITILISLGMLGPLSEGDPFATDAFILQPGNFHAPQLVGSLFVHAGMLHLVGNMLFLFVFGNAVNAKLGHVKYILLYLGIGVVESTVWLLCASNPCLGASGAIMGIVGAFLLLYPLNEVSIAYMFTIFYRGVFDISAMWVIACYIAFDIWGLVKAGNDGIGYLAHVAGFATGAGVMAALLWFKLTVMERDEKSLLQVWNVMPHEVDDAPPPPRRITSLEAYKAVRENQGTAKSQVRRTQRSISLD